jgi:hypothetical protein
LLPEQFDEINVGLTAAFSVKLAEKNISANVGCGVLS